MGNFGVKEILDGADSLSFGVGYALLFLRVVI